MSQVSPQFPTGSSWESEQRRVESIQKRLQSWFAFRRIAACAEVCKLQATSTFVLPFLLKLLADRRKRVVEAATTAVKYIGPLGIPVLFIALRSDSPVRHVVKEILESYGEAGRIELHALAKKYAGTRESLEAIDLLVELDASMIQELLEVLEREALARKAGSITNRPRYEIEYGRSLPALIARRKLGKLGASIIPDLSLRLSHADMRVREEIAIVLGGCGNDAVSLLIEKCLADPDETVRNAAKYSLSHIGLYATMEVGRALRESNIVVRNSALEILFEQLPDKRGETCSSEVGYTLPEIVHVIAHADDPFRRNVIKLIRCYRQEESLQSRSRIRYLTSDVATEIAEQRAKEVLRIEADVVCRAALQAMNHVDEVTREIAMWFIAMAAAGVSEGFRSNVKDALEFCQIVETSDRVLRGIKHARGMFEET